MEQEEIRGELIKMIATPGWSIFEIWLKDNIKKSKSITSIRTSSDQEILLTFRLAQSRVSVYNTIFEWVKSNTEEKKNG